jgi:tetratricopeptide (TPR) repeat protein
MALPDKTPIARRTPVVLAALTAIAVVAFILVSRLVTRYRANERQVAWHVFEQGQRSFRSGNPARAIDDFRTALFYDPDNSRYQLELARALRDSGKPGSLDEAASYLTALWQGKPEDGVINLALARLAVRRDSLPDALRYYHNAIYGAWDSDPDSNRRSARFELIHFLMQRKAYAQAESELINISQSMPPDPALHLQVAGLYAAIADYDRAISAYNQVLKLDPQNAAALAGAGNTAFQLGRYRTAQEYLTRAVEADPTDSQSHHSLETANLVLTADPFRRRITDAERDRRLLAAFDAAGKRLQACALSNHVDLRNPISPANPLQTLQSSWDALNPRLRNLRSSLDTDLPDNIMDLVAQIERQASQQCGPPAGLDLALLLISRDRDTVDQ